MRYKILMFLIAVFSCWFVAGFQPTSLATEPTDSAYKRPQILILYFPYDVSMPRSIASPVPDYQGCSLDRIERDFNRFVDLGVDGVLVGLPLDRLAEPGMIEMYTDFLDMAERRENWPEIAFYAYVNDRLDNAAEDIFSRVIVGLLAGRPAGYLQLSGRPLVVFSPNVIWRFRHPALTIRMTSVKFTDWPVNNSSSSMIGASGKVENIWISPLPHDYMITSENQLRDMREPDAFAKTLETLLKSGISEFITIYSWNDFSNGTFIEPNSIDGYNMSRAIYRVLQHQ